MCSILLLKKAADGWLIPCQTRDLLGPKIGLEVLRNLCTLLLVS